MENRGSEIFKEIDQIAKKNGALLVGTTKIRKTEPVIIFAFPFTNTWFFNHPFSLTLKLGQEYKESKNVQNLVASILKKEGYRAEFKTILSIYGDFRPLAVAAGLGHWGKNGLVVTKDYGSGVLFSAIFTDAPLEITRPLDHELSHDFECHSCNQCIDSCPGNAFANNKFHFFRCLPYALKGCGECVKNCK